MLARASPKPIATRGLGSIVGFDSTVLDHGTVGAQPIDTTGPQRVRTTLAISGRCFRIVSTIVHRRNPARQTCRKRSQANLTRFIHEHRKAPVSGTSVRVAPAARVVGLGGGRDGLGGAPRPRGSGRELDGTAGEQRPAGLVGKAGWQGHLDPGDHLVSVVARPFWGSYSGRMGEDATSLSPGLSRPLARLLRALGGL